MLIFSVFSSVTVIFLIVYTQYLKKKKEKDISINSMTNIVKEFLSMF